MHQQPNNLRPEKLRILHHVFQRLVSDHSAVSHHRRRDIAQRVIIAARQSFETADELIAIANGLEDHSLHDA